MGIVYDKPYLKLAAKIMGVDAPQLPESLVDFLDIIDTNASVIGVSLQSREVIALAVTIWENQK